MRQLPFEYEFYTDFHPLIDRDDSSRDPQPIDLTLISHVNDEILLF